MKEKKKKILIISMSAGFGHIRAGEALLDYAKENVSSVKVDHIDACEIDPSLKKYSHWYEVASKKIPLLWRFLYYNSLVVSLSKKILGVRGLCNKKIKEYINKKKPDAIIFTNIIVSPLFGWYCKKMFPTIKMGIVVTDYHGHSYYQFPFINYYFVANEKVAQDLQSNGVEQEKILITGIPINPKFYIQQKVKDLKSHYGIKNDFPVVLCVASFKTSKELLIETIEKVLAISKINVIVVANGNNELYQTVKHSLGGRTRLFIINWTNKIEEYIKMADVVISKAGGLTVSECLTLKKPMIIVNPIPGQEEHNAAFVVENNAGVKVKHINEIPDVVPQMIALSKKIAKETSKGLVPKENPSKKIINIFNKSF